MAERRDQRRLGEMLIDQGLIGRDQLEAALKEQEATGRFIGEILVGMGASDEETITKSLSGQLGFAYVDLAHITVEQKATELVPEEVCVKHRIVPLFIVHNTLTLAMANPLDVKVIDEIQSISNLRVRPVFACPSSITNAIDRYYRAAKEAPEPIPVEEGPIFQTGTPPGAPLQKEPDEAVTTEQVTFLKQAASLAPVVEIVDSIVAKAVEMNASDVHLEPQKESLSCRYRIDGVLHPISQIPPDNQAAVISRIKIMANMDIAEKRLPQDGRVRMFAADREVDLRISTFPSIYGENIVIRILDRSAGILHLKQLGFSDESYELFSDLIRRPYGIILVTGPTGSGKTTTLYAALSEINNVEKNIITLEDPVEYEISNVRQSQVNVKAGLTFAAGLRSIVRQDPDIIMIGEIRDKETADIAIHAALTGHLVFSTLHTNDAPSAVTRLVDMGVEPFLVSSSVIGIIAQRLVRTLCTTCKVEYKPSKELLSKLGLDRPTESKKTKKSKEGNKTFYKEVGCKRCKKRGYLGRTGIYELLVPNERIKELIAQKATAAVLRDEAVKGGMKTLRDDGLEKVATGVTSISEVLRVTEEA